VTSDFSSIANMFQRDIAGTILLYQLVEQDRMNHARQTFDRFK
jgi:hypothetical protein